MVSTSQRRLQSLANNISKIAKEFGMKISVRKTRSYVDIFAVAGAKIWNSLQADLWLHAQSIETFEQKLKQYLFKCIWGFLFCAIQIYSSSLSSSIIIIIIIWRQKGTRIKILIDRQQKVEEVDWFKHVGVWSLLMAIVENRCPVRNSFDDASIYR